MGGTVEFEVAPGEAGERFDVLVARHAGVSRAAAARLIEEGAARAGDAAASKATRLAAGTRVMVALRDAPAAPAPEDRTVPVVYEDASLLVVSKPAGLVVHPAPGNPSGTLVNALLARAGRPAGGAAERPGIVHRLDAGTSGLMVVAKTEEVYERLVRMMAAREVARTYLALVEGEPREEAATVDAPVGRSARHRKKMAVVASGRAAVTRFEVRERFGQAALLEVRPETGRTHQIRVHLAAIGHPVVGDRVYGRDRKLSARLGLARPFLHAWRLAFAHPVSGEPLALEDPLPEDLAAALRALRASDGR